MKVLCSALDTKFKYERRERRGASAAGEVVEIAQPVKVNVGDRVVVMPGFGCGKCRFCLAGDCIHRQYPPNAEKGTGRASCSTMESRIDPSYDVDPVGVNAPCFYGFTAGSTG